MQLELVTAAQYGDWPITWFTFTSEVELKVTSALGVSPTHRDSNSLSSSTAWVLLFLLIPQIILNNIQDPVTCFLNQASVLLGSVRL